MWQRLTSWFETKEGRFKRIKARVKDSVFSALADTNALVEPLWEVLNQEDQYKAAAGAEKDGILPSLRSALGDAKRALKSEGITGDALEALEEKLTAYQPTGPAQGT